MTAMATPKSPIPGYRLVPLVETPRPWLDAFMREHGIVKSALARRLGLAPTALNRLINGERRIKPGQLETIAEFLRVRLEWVKTGEGDPYQ